MNINQLHETIERTSRVPEVKTSPQGNWFWITY